MSYRVLLFVLVVGSCGPALKVPQVASGNVPFRVINDTDFKYCEFLMAEPHDPPTGLGPSWIAKGRWIDPHTTFDLKVRPGLYQIYAGACEPAGGATEEPSGESEPTAAAPAGESCKGPGEETSNINDCCSKRDRIVSSQGFSHSVCCDANGPCESTR